MKVWVKIVNQRVLFLLGAHRKAKKVEKSLSIEKNPTIHQNLLIIYFPMRVSLLRRETNMFQN